VLVILPDLFNGSGNQSTLFSDKIITFLLQPLDQTLQILLAPVVVHIFHIAFLVPGLVLREDYEVGSSVVDSHYFFFKAQRLFLLLVCHLLGRVVVSFEFFAPHWA